MPFILIHLAASAWTRDAVTAVCRLFAPRPVPQPLVNTRRAFIVLGRYVRPGVPEQPPSNDEWFSYFESRAIANAHQVGLEWVTMHGESLHTALIDTARTVNATRIYAQPPTSTAAELHSAYHLLLRDYLAEYALTLASA